MRKALIIIDMQNDFITGALVNKEGQKIVPKIADFAEKFDGDIIATMDTHGNDYLDTQEGRKLPVPHCIENTEGWKIVPSIQKVLDKKHELSYALNTKPYIVDKIKKDTFGSHLLAVDVSRRRYDEVLLCGVCTDICVINNAMMIKALAPETKITVLKDLCAGVTPESHETALKAMAACQIEVA